MVEPKKKPPIPANVVAVDQHVEPIKSVVVGDARRNFGKRLGLMAIALLLLFFTISSYIQSSQNGRLLHRAAVDRSRLILTIHHLARSNVTQTHEIGQLQKAIRAQNRELREAGFKVVHIPVDHSSSSPSEPPSSSSKPTPQPTSAPSPTPRPKPSPKPTPKPSPSHTPGPVQDLRDRICSLTGICLVLDVIQFLIS